MDALVLVGGYATRLQPLTLRTPKSLVPVAGQPALAHILAKLREAGAKEVLVSLNPSQRKVEEYFNSGERYGLHLHYHYEQHRGEEHKPGAIGAIQEAVDEYGPPKKGLIVGGDNYVHGLDFGELVKLRERRKAAAAIAFYDLANKNLVEHYGIAALDKEGRVTQFQEKPRVEEAVSKLASTAFYACSAEFLTKHVPAYVHGKRKAGEKPDRLGDLFRHYVKDQPIYGLPFQGVWGDANTPETYVEMNKLAMNHLATQTKGAGKGREVVMGKDVKVGEGAVIKGPAILEEGCVVGGGAVIGPYTHLLHHAEVGAKSLVTGSILFEHARIGEGAHVEDSVVDGRAEIGDDARVESYSLIGYETKVGPRSRVLGRSRLWPLLEVGDESVVEGTLKTALGSEEGKELEGSRYWKD